MLPCHSMIDLQVGRQCNLQPRPMYPCHSRVLPFAGAQGNAGAAGSQKAAQALEAGFAALNTTPGSSSSPVNPWCNAHPGSMQRLRVLHLQDCPKVFWQLAEWQEQQLRSASIICPASGASQDSSDGSNSSSDRIRPGLDRVEGLLLTGLENISHELPMLLIGQKKLQASNQPSHAASSSSTATLSPWPLQHLSALHISRCRVVDVAAEVLPLLPALQSFEAYKCNLWEVPAGVCDSTALTQLKLPQNQLHCLPSAISKLQQLQVGIRAASIP